LKEIELSYFLKRDTHNSWKPLKFFKTVKDQVLFKNKSGNAAGINSFFTKKAEKWKNLSKE